MPCSCAVSTTSCGGGPSALTSSDGECCNAISICGPRGRVGPAEQVVAALDVVGQRRDVVVGEHLLDELPVLLRDHLLELRLEVVGARRPPGSSTLAGITRSTPYGLPSTCSSIHFSSISSSSGVKYERAEHAHASGPAHRGDDVTAMAEREDREFEAEFAGELRAHDADRRDAASHTCNTF